MTKVARIPTGLHERLIDRHGMRPHMRVYSDNLLVRELFWRRLDAVLSLSNPPSAERALDFGGGNGVLLPTLSSRYREVVTVDLRAGMADELRRALGLPNVTVHEADLYSLELDSDGFDTVVATDVLEHIPDLPRLAAEFRRILRPGGELLVTAPSENRFYRAGRRVFNYRKVDDHFHDADYVGRSVGESLTLTSKRWFPVPLRPLGVFAIERFEKR